MLINELPCGFLEFEETQGTDSGSQNAALSSPFSHCHTFQQDKDNGMESLRVCQYRQHKNQSMRQGTKQKVVRVVLSQTRITGLSE